MRAYAYRVNFTDPIIHKRTKCHQLQAPRLPGLWHSWLVTGDRQWSRKIAELGPLPGCLSVGRGPPWPTRESGFVRLPSSPPSQHAAQLQQILLILAFATFPDLSPFIRQYTTSLALLRHNPFTLAFAVEYCIYYPFFQMPLCSGIYS
jgi:hypothetical protein